MSINVEKLAVALLANSLSPANYLKLLEIAKPLESLQQAIQRPSYFDAIPEFCHVLRYKSDFQPYLDKAHLWAKQGYMALDFKDADYPEGLRQSNCPPAFLFYLGPIERINQGQLISIVGSREADRLGVELAHDLAQGLASHGVCVVSGLAIGIDAAAHQGALDSKSAFPTIAVMGNGLATVYPAANRRLYQDILDHGGVVLSQFEPEMPAMPYNFLDRNRVIAGLSLGTIVTQAASRSGSLNTARYALEYGREVMALPGSMNDPRFQGTNQLIKQGASIVTSIDDVFEYVGGLQNLKHVGLAKDQVIGQDLSEIQKNVMRHLEKELSIHHDDLLAELGIERTHFSAEILDLELSGLIERAAGNHLVLKRKTFV